jgi:hypothetical protein
MLILAACEVSTAPAAGPPDAALEDECDLFDEASCPAGQKCYFNPLAIRCVPVGEHLVGERCNLVQAADDCVAGAHCSPYGVSMANVASPKVCRRYCIEDGQCAAGEGCLGFGSHTLGVCVPACAPFAGDCAADRTCVLTLSGSYCRDFGELPVWASCSTMVNSCPADTHCIGLDGAPQLCRPFCDTIAGGAGSHPCPDGKTCRAWADTGFGHCL